MVHVCGALHCVIILVSLLLSYFIISRPMQDMMSHRKSKCQYILELPCLTLTMLFMQHKCSVWVTTNIVITELLFILLLLDSYKFMSKSTRLYVTVITVVNYLLCWLTLPFRYMGSLIWCNVYRFNFPKQYEKCCRNLIQEKYRTQSWQEVGRQWRNISRPSQCAFYCIVCFYYRAMHVVQSAVLLS